MVFGACSRLGATTHRATQDGMSKRIPPVLASFVTALVFSALQSSAAAPDPAQVYTDWVPGLSIYTAGLVEDRSATANSLRFGFQDGETVGFSWSIGAEAELASPPLFGDEFRTRFVMHGGGGYVTDADDPVTTIGDPGDRPAVSPFQPDADSIENQGGAVRAQAKPWVLTGGVGAQIEIEAFSRTIFLKPTLEWMYRRDTIQGVLGVGELETADGNGNCGPCRILFVNAEREKGYHSLGVGLDASLDGRRAGPLLIRIFASGRFYYVLGDRKSDLVATAPWLREDGTPSGLAPTTGTYTLRYEREPVHYRVGIGIRFLWSPERRDRF